MSEALLFDEISAAIRLQQRIVQLHERAAMEADAMALENELAAEQKWDSDATASSGDDSANKDGEG
jgi:hypothetical protein